MSAPGADEDVGLRAARRRTLLVLAAILVVAAVLRLPGLFSGPGYGSRDELMYVPKAIRFGGGDLNPHYFQNPPLASYLMFGAQGALYAVQRIAGTVAGPLDFKAQYFADATAAFVAARSVSLVLGLGAVAATFVLARRVARIATAAAVRGIDASSLAGRADFAGASAAGLLAVSPLHVERSAMATNESLVVCVYALAVVAALRLLAQGTARAACAAGLLAGIAAGSKYTGVVLCAAVGVAALCAQGEVAAIDASRRAGRRARLLAAGAAASVAGFLVVCPWAVLDRSTFLAHIENLGTSRDRMPEASLLVELVRSLRTYAGTLWDDGLGPVGAVLAAVGVVAAVWTALRGRRDAALRGAALVLLASIVPIAGVLVVHTGMALGRYLMPAYPVLLALGAAAIAAAPGAGGTWFRRGTLAGALVCAAATVADLPERIATARAEDTQARLAAWMHDHVPDGAIVVCDWYAPRLVPIEARGEFEGRVPAATLARLRPAFRVVTAFDYFALPLNSVDGVPADDFARLRALGDVYVIESEQGVSVYDALPPGDYPGRAWYRAVEALPVVREERPGPGVRGPVLRLRRVP